jgi:hypothetical protein
MNEFKVKIATALHSLLANNIVSFTFRKVNGELRHAKGTRNLDLARAHTGAYIPNPVYGEQPNSYYDVECNGWRSYKPENLISIDGVVARTDTDFAKKPTSPNEPKHYPDDPIDLGFLGDGIPKELIHKSWEELDKDIVIGAPAHNPKISTPVGGVPVEDFAKMVAHYVVDELITRLTR